MDIAIKPKQYAQASVMITSNVETKNSTLDTFNHSRTTVDDLGDSDSNHSEC